MPILRYYDFTGPFMTLPADNGLGGVNDAQNFHSGELRTSVSEAGQVGNLTFANGRCRSLVKTQDPALLGGAFPFHHRSEIHTNNWSPKWDPTSCEWVGVTYWWPTPYIISQQGQWVFNQSHQGNPTGGTSLYSPLWTFEVSKINQARDPENGNNYLPAGSIQYVNHPASVRKGIKMGGGITDYVIPVAGTRIDIIKRIFYARLDTQGIPGEDTVWVSVNQGPWVQVHNAFQNTIWPIPENYGGRTKWGIYAHSWKNDPTNLAVFNEGITQLYIEFSNITQLVLMPGERINPTKAFDFVNPQRNLDERLWLGFKESQLYKTAGGKEFIINRGLPVELLKEAS